MEDKVCTRCGPPAQPIDNFAIRSRKKGTRQAMCRRCQNDYGKAHYQTYRTAYLLKARRWNDNQNRINAEFVIGYLSSHPCVDCGERDIVLLQLDHLRDKTADVSALSREGYSLDRIKQEIAKCEVVCANCHLRRTAIRGGWYKLKAD